MTIGTADVSAGVGTVSAINPVTITNALKLPNSVTATVTGATFAASGANLANAAATNNLTLCGGTLSLAVPLAGAINVVTGALSYTGTGPSLDTGTTWNLPGLNGTSAGLLNSSNAVTTVTYEQAGNDYHYSPAPPPERPPSPIQGSTATPCPCSTVTQNHN